MASKYSKEIIEEIRKEVLGGKNKHRVAKEKNLCVKTVYYYTRDLPSTNPGRTEIRGNTLYLLKKLLKEGLIVSNARNNANLRTLQKHFPSIKRSQFKKRSVYYLEDKNKLALKEMMKQNKSRIINYQELGRVCQVFNTDLEINQKRAFLGKKLKPRRYKTNKFRKYTQFISKEKQTKIDDFFGRFLHSELLTHSIIDNKIQYCQDSIYFFSI
jgi:hypothetical protein